MAAAEMADLNLPPNASDDDIEQELLFNQVVLQTIESDEYAYDVVEIEADAKDKIRRLNNLLQQRKEATRQHDAAMAPGKKRARVDSISDALDARDIKTHRSSPQSDSEDSSDSDIEFLMSKPISRGVEQQRRMEQMLAQQSAQMKRDAEMARVMATQSTPNLGASHLQPTPGRNNSMAGPTPFPQTPPRLGHNLALRSPQQATSNWPIMPRHSVGNLEARAKPFNFDDFELKPRNNSVPHSAQQSSSSNETRLSDSDDSLEEITPADFQVNPRSVERMKQAQAQRQTLPYNTQVNGFARPQTNGFGHPHLNTHPNFYATMPNPFALAPLIPSSTMHPYPMQNLAPPFGSTQPMPAFGSSLNPLRGFGDVVGTAIGDIMSQVEQGPSSLADPHSYLYSDPTRNAEEIQALLKNIRPDEDLPAELRKGTPAEMATTLLEHQKLGLTWLTRQEEGSNKGGILADDMGLGKTIQAIALMVSRRAEDERKTNLIVGPVALLGQWQSEIEDKVKSHYKLSIFRYHGTKCSFNKLKKYDVVLTTYGTLGSEWKKYNEWERNKIMNPDQDHPPLDLPLTGKDSKWYRYEHRPWSISLTFQGDS
jgi:SNF2-related domain